MAVLTRQHIVNNLLEDHRLIAWNKEYVDSFISLPSGFAFDNELSITEFDFEHGHYPQ